ncbi:MAG TPA: hypothetical protein VHK27_10300, partial [Gammaproteobacteria bacterium]|nr:hypothetical protein [Gammaproteobacteria bacterium]
AMDCSSLAFILTVGRIFPGTIGDTVKRNKLALAGRGLCAHASAPAAAAPAIAIIKKTRTVADGSTAD